MWNSWDWFAVIVHKIGIVTVIAFYIFVCWFVLAKVKPLNLKLDQERREIHEHALLAAGHQFQKNQRKS